MDDKTKINLDLALKNEIQKTEQNIEKLKRQLIFHDVSDELREKINDYIDKCNALLQNVKDEYARENEKLGTNNSSTSLYFHNQFDGKHMVLKLKTDVLKKYKGEKKVDDMKTNKSTIGCGCMSNEKSVLKIHGLPFFLHNNTSDANISCTKSIKSFSSSKDNFGFLNKMLYYLRNAEDLSKNKNDQKQFSSAASSDTRICNTFYTNNYVIMSVKKRLKGNKSVCEIPIEVNHLENHERERGGQNSYTLNGDQRVFLGNQKNLHRCNHDNQNIFEDCNPVNQKIFDHYNSANQTNFHHYNTIGKKMTNNPVNPKVFVQCDPVNQKNCNYCHQVDQKMINNLIYPKAFDTCIPATKNFDHYNPHNQNIINNRANQNCFDRCSPMKQKPFNHPATPKMFGDCNRNSRNMIIPTTFQTPVNPKLINHRDRVNQIYNGINPQLFYHCYPTYVHCDPYGQNTNRNRDPKNKKGPNLIKNKMAHNPHNKINSNKTASAYYEDMIPERDVNCSSKNLKLSDHSNNQTVDYYCTPNKTVHTATIGHHSPDRRLYAPCNSKMAGNASHQNNMGTYQNLHNHKPIYHLNRNNHRFNPNKTDCCNPNKIDYRSNNSKNVNQKKTSNDATGCKSSCCCNYNCDASSLDNKKINYSCSSDDQKTLKKSKTTRSIMARNCKPGTSQSTSDSEPQICQGYNAKQQKNKKTCKEKKSKIWGRKSRYGEDYKKKISWFFYKPFKTKRMSGRRAGRKCGCQPCCKSKTKVDTKSCDQVQKFIFQRTFELEVKEGDSRLSCCANYPYAPSLDSLPITVPLCNFSAYKGRDLIKFPYTPMEIPKCQLKPSCKFLCNDVLREGICLDKSNYCRTNMKIREFLQCLEKKVQRNLRKCSPGICQLILGDYRQPCKRRKYKKINLRVYENPNDCFVTKPRNAYDNQYSNSNQDDVSGTPDYCCDKPKRNWFWRQRSGKETVSKKNKKSKDSKNVILGKSIPSDIELSMKQISDECTLYNNEYAQDNITDITKSNSFETDTNLHICDDPQKDSYYWISSAKSEDSSVSFSGSEFIDYGFASKVIDYNEDKSTSRNSTRKKCEFPSDLSVNNTKYSRSARNNNEIPRNKSEGNFNTKFRNKFRQDDVYRSCSEPVLSELSINKTSCVEPLPHKMTYDRPNKSYKRNFYNNEPQSSKCGGRSYNNDPQSSKCDPSFYHNEPQSSKRSPGFYHNESQSSKDSAGSYNNESRSSKCSAGSYNNESQSSKCSAGSYNNESRSSKCSAGSYNNESQSLKCSRDFYINEPQSSKCSPAFYNNEPQSSKCDPNNTSNNVAQKRSKKRRKKNIINELIQVSKSVLNPCIMNNSNSTVENVCNKPGHKTCYLKISGLPNVSADKLVWAKAKVRCKSDDTQIYEIKQLLDKPQKKNKKPH